MAGLAAAPARALGSTYVSLEFDNGAISQYTLGYLQALQPHSVKATFFVSSGTVGASGNFMTWSQLGALEDDGHDIGGKSVNATNLTTDPNPTAQVCNDRAAILQHGLTPVAFAYPGGAHNTSVQSVVRSCQYGNARTAGGVSPGGAVEALPPANWFATKAYAPSAVTLANMQAVVNGADTRGGGWAQIVIGRVCSQALDPGNYTACSAASGHIELADLNAFLDWMANAGQAGGAPAGATLSQLSDAVATADDEAPSTTIACNGAPCTSTPYPDVVSVTLAPTDSGSGVASTHYSVDGSEPTLASPTYTGAFNVNSATSSTTVKYRSWDLDGNAEAVNTQVIEAPPDTVSPTTTISCNGATCGNGPYVGSVTIALSATDTGGSGIAATYYTTDGSTPTTASTAYSVPFQLASPGTHDVRFFSTDQAGNAEQVGTQQVTVVPVTTKVSLTFDNGTVGQYNLAYLQALEPHDAHATFYVNTGNVGVSTAIMTWAQLAALAADGHDIGGKSVSATNLTTDPNPTAQVCNDRAALVRHGLDPVGFAYPGGASNATVKGIVHDCGYGVARTAGSLSPTGPRYAETLAPADWYATRAYAPTGQVTLANMQALVNGAASNGGGWSQIVITRVCSQTADPGGYASCTTGSGWIELDDLDTFLDWMADAGQPGGAPAGASLATVREAAVGADTIAPVTTAACNGAACGSGTYTSTVYVTLSSTDVGSAVDTIRYTTDGSTPTLASPTYTKRIPVTSTTTVTFRSWDNAGNAEAANTLVIEADLPPDGTAPTTTVSCDGSPCSPEDDNGSTSVAFAADDGAGWGVDATYYTTDGSTPTTSSTVYDGPFTLTPGTYTIRFFSTDLAGNAEQVHSQALTILPARVVVTFGFDDGDLNQYTLAYQRALEPHGMRGTFYINTENLASGPGFMTWAELADMGQNGQDIGGHTQHHIDLTSSSYSQQQKINEVCDDRQALVDHGFAATSFAYPFGAHDANAEAIVEACGYTDARRTGGIPLNGAPYAETIPPQDRYVTITWTAPTPTTSPIQLSDMKNAVNNAAANGGGWVQIVIHHVCSQTHEPENYGTCMGTFRPMELDTLNAFMDWLESSGQPAGAPPRTQVQSVTEVINGPDQQAPVTTLLCDGSPCTADAYTDSTTVSLAAVDTGGSGLAATHYTTDGSSPTTSSPKYTSPFALTQTTTVRFFSVDHAGNAEATKTQTVQVENAPPPDSTAPTTAIACNGAPCSGWYQGAQVTLTASDNVGGRGVDATYYTTDGSTPTTSSSVYSGPFALASTSTVRYFSVDNAGNAEAAKSQTVQVDGVPPATTVRCNNAGCSTGWYTSDVSVTLAAADDAGGSGVAATYYTTDGSTPTSSSTRYTGAFSLTQTGTVKFFSVDVAGSAEAVKSQLVQIDGTRPTTTITCNGAACSGSTYSAPVSVALNASDGAGGSGVASTHYTTNGTTPTLSSPTYTGPITLTSTTTVRYRSWDVAGNVESVKSQTIRVTAAPVARLSLSPTSGAAPLLVTADASASTAGNAPIVSYSFNFGDGTSTVTQLLPRATHTYTKTGTFTVTVTVRDLAGLSSTATAKVTVKRK